MPKLMERANCPNCLVQTNITMARQTDTNYRNALLLKIYQLNE